MAYVNFHAFVANLDERRIFRTRPTWAIWAMRDAHETSLAQNGNSTRDEHVLAAAQWILWYGQTLFKGIICLGDTPGDLGPWTPGLLYGGRADLSIERWHFWRHGFRAVGFGGKEDERAYGEVCRKVAARAAEMMDALEKEMIF